MFTTFYKDSFSTDSKIDRFVIKNYHFQVANSWHSSQFLRVRSTITEHKLKIWFCCENKRDAAAASAMF